MSYIQSYRACRQPPFAAQEPSADLAAAKIQAGFRGYQVRKKYPHRSPVASSKSTLEDKHNSHITAATEGPAIYKSTTASTRKAVTAHPATDVDRAASRIQASFRDYMARRTKKSKAPIGESRVQFDKALAQTRPVQKLTAGDMFGSKPVTLPLRTRNQNIRLTSPDNPMQPCDPTTEAELIEVSMLNKAATVIQSNYRGYHTRKTLHSGELALQHDSPHQVTEKCDQPESNKENADQAATRIQAVYRGFIARKRLKSSHMPTADSYALGSSRFGRLSPSEAATRIQAAYRGFSTRQHYSLPKRNSHLIK